MKLFNIQKTSKTLEKELKHKINFKTKPLGSLGKLEDLALKIGLVQNTLIPQLRNPHIVVFAADHGIANSGVSAYPQEVTYQMVMNFLTGGAAINVFCKQNNINIQIVNAGVNHKFPTGLNMIDTKAGPGTKNFLEEPAMSMNQAEVCITKGSEIVEKIYQSGCNVIGFGEMGIANTSSAGVLMSLLCDIPLTDCIGRGAGLNDEQLKQKVEILSTAVMKHGNTEITYETLATYGGFEIAQMCGAMLQAAENKMIILVDGFIAGAAFLVAYKLYPEVMDYAVFCHLSNENGHKKMLEYLGVKPLLHLSMRLGEGSGVAVEIGRAHV